MSDATKAEAEVRILRAMVHLEAAQNELDRAFQELSAITFWAPEYSRVGRLHQQVKTQWFRMNARLIGGKYDLDSFAAERFAGTPDRSAVGSE